MSVAHALPNVVGMPHTGPALRAELRRVHADSVAYWARFDTSAFFAPLGAAWSPSEHVRHLTKSMRPVALALRLPRVALRLTFGAPGHASRSYDAIERDYHAVLAAGGTAGRYTPAPRSAGAFPEIERARIMAEHAKAVASLDRAAARWSEDALDAIALPHPLLGRLSVREMLCFTVYHAVHHVRVAERRSRR